MSKWTKKPPTKPGVYWMRNKQRTSGRIFTTQLAKVCYSLGNLVFILEWNDTEYLVNDYPESEWCGPFVPPKE